MHQTWKTFDAWLAQHWPEGLASLNPPASDEQIARLEAALGVRLPADYVACLKVHDGQHGYAGLIDGAEFLSCDAILDQWTVWKELLDGGDFEDTRSSPPPGVRDDWWNPRWIPFTHDGGGNHLCLDLDPAPAGIEGQVIEMWHDADERPLRATGFGAFFEAYVADVVAGRIVYSEEYGGLVGADEVD